MPQLTASYSSGVLTISLANPSTTAGANPTGVTCDVLGTPVQLTFDANNQATLPITVDPSLASWSIPVTITPAGGDGSTPAIRPDLGRSGGNFNNVQLIKPAKSGDPYQVFPTLRTILQAHYFGALATNPMESLGAYMASFQDLDVLSQITTNLLAKVVDALVSASTLTLSTAEQAAWSDFKANVLPNLKYNVGNILDSSSKPVTVYQQLITDSGTFLAALNGYENAVATITAAGGTLS